LRAANRRRWRRTQLSWRARRRRARILAPDALARALLNPSVTRREGGVAMMSITRLSSRSWRVLRWVGLGAGATALWACTSHTLETPDIVPQAVMTQTITQKVNNNLDILFMIDNSSSMTSMQQKLLAQLPNFMNVLEGLPMKPNLHVAVISSDLGAPSDTNIGCTASGDQGKFYSQPEGSCTGTTITMGDTYISDVDGVANFTDPIATVFQCIGLTGENGCGFEHQLASIDRALGSDGNGPPPSTNNGFLRDEAYLGIVMLTNEDDCSATSNTTIYSLNDQPQSITNSDGPIANYRCNGGPRGGHLCQDPNSSNPTAYATPPLTPPGDATTGTPPILQLAGCEDNESGSSALIPVSQFVSDIKSLKPDPDNQILVGEIIAPAKPYGVGWFPGMPTSGASELWPSVLHSCGTADDPYVNPDPSAQTVTDMSFGDPGVRETQFANAFMDSVVFSICDADYTQSMTEIAMKLTAFLKAPCITQKVQTDAQGNPACSVTENLTDSNNNTTHIAIPNCMENGNTAPCWNMVPGDPTMGCTGNTISVTDTAANMMANSENSTVQCSLCLAGVPGPGC
jgi:hypothetical protein